MDIHAAKADYESSRSGGSHDRAWLATMSISTKRNREMNWGPWRRHCNQETRAVCAILDLDPVGVIGLNGVWLKCYQSVDTHSFQSPLRVEGHECTWNGPMAFLCRGDPRCPRIADLFPARSSRSIPSCLFGLFHPGPALRELGPTQRDANSRRRPGSFQPLLRYHLRHRLGRVRIERGRCIAALAWQWPGLWYPRGFYRLPGRE